MCECVCVSVKVGASACECESGCKYVCVFRFLFLLNVARRCL